MAYTITFNAPEGLKDLPTTVPGIVVAALTAAAHYFPEYGGWFTQVAGIAAAIGLLLAKGDTKPPAVPLFGAKVPEG